MPSNWAVGHMAQLSVITVISTTTLILSTIALYKQVNSPHRTQSASTKSTSTMPASPVPTTPEKRPYDPPDFDRCTRLQDILKRIKAHLACSDTTIRRYFHVCEIFNRQLQTPLPLDDICEDRIRDILVTRWPVFTPLRDGSMVKPLYGKTSKVPGSSESSDEVQIDPDLVQALEDAPHDSDRYIFLQMVLIITALHELDHHLTKHLFGYETSPAACGPSAPGSINGESGILLEELLFGGVISMLSEVGDKGDMNKICALSMGYRDSERLLLANDCRPFLASLDSPELAFIRFSALKGYSKKSFNRFRPGLRDLTSLEKSPDSIPPGMALQRGLGLMDRYERLFYDENGNLGRLPEHERI